MACVTYNAHLRRTTSCSRCWRTCPTRRGSSRSCGAWTPSWSSTSSRSATTSAKQRPSHRSEQHCTCSFHSPPQSQLRVKPYVETAAAFLTREVQVVCCCAIHPLTHQEFLDGDLGREPFTSFRHHLYVYPLQADLRATAHRNIACRVEFLEREAATTSEAQGLNCFYNRLDLGLSKSATTGVTYHDKARGVPQLAA